ncbi:heterokaryon incompatibility protein-domain-containing protein [Phaeosphaeriaceae sp. PMI808]|nr:heterokaryon incompatibility protein-domain-containing protein [Phaeosphaeriaceae sp. PMI808]
MGPKNSVGQNAAKFLQRFRYNVQRTLARWLHLGYVYGPALPIGSIRVLRLLPGKIGDPISCVLRTKALEEAEETYDAISYCWGSESRPRTICCNGCSISITPNLFDALQHFRHPIDIRDLWVDAICINQQDQVEKGHQVRKMDKVYEKARQVIAWIGRDDDGLAEDCFALIRDTVSFLDQAYISSGQKYFPPLETTSCPISVDQRRWDGVRELLNKDWFLRVWVVQEAGLGKTCFLNWGPHCLSFVDLVELMYFVEWRSDLGPFTGNLGTTPARILDSFNYIQSGFDNPQSWRTSRPVLSWRLSQYTSELFMNVILGSRKLKASDRRDHVYAFLGSPMARRQDGELIVEPNYGKNKHPEDVFVEFAIALLRNRKEAPWVLLFVDHKSEDDLKAAHLPSWAPCWDPSPYSVLAEVAYWYRAGGDSILFHPEVHETSRQLKLDSYFFDHIEWVSAPISGDSLGFDPARWTVQPSGDDYLDELWSELVTIAGCNDQSFFDSFLYCLVRGFPFTRGPSSTDVYKLRADFRAYRSRLLSLKGTNVLPSHVQKNGNAWRIASEVINLDNKRLIFTKARRLGIAPSLSHPGDRCCIVPGLANPLILRPSSSTSGSYNLVGGSYINDIMNGELLREDEIGGLKTEAITLV